MGVICIAINTNVAIAQMFRWFAIQNGENDYLDNQISVNVFHPSRSNAVRWR